MADKDSVEYDETKIKSDKDSETFHFAVNPKLRYPLTDSSQTRSSDWKRRIKLTPWKNGVSREPTFEI